MSDNVIIDSWFREARANKHSNASLWTPLDCLKAAVRDIEDGSLKPVSAVYIAMLRKDPGGNAADFPFYTAGLTALELRGVLTQHLHDICARFGKT